MDCCYFILFNIWKDRSGNPVRSATGMSGYGVTEITGLQKLRERLVTSRNCSVGNLYSQKIFNTIHSIYLIVLFNFANMQHN